MEFRRPHVKYLEGDSIEPCNRRKAEVEAHAAKIASILKFQIGEPQDFAWRIGARIHYQHIEEWGTESGSIFVHAADDLDILLPYYTSPRRDQFTIAHELGHYFLHSGIGKTPIIAYRQGSTRIEWEANWFAAALLMPAEAFAEELKRKKEIAAVAAVFRVSEEAAQIRKESLGV